MRLVVLVLALCAALVAPTGAQPVRGSAAILVYHRFGPTAAFTTVSDVVLDEQLSWLASHVRVARLHDVLDALRAGEASVQRPCVAITVDDGHRSVYTDLYPRIVRLRLPVTLFIYPSAISNASYALTWAELSEMVRSGLIDVQSHTFWHPNFHHEKSRRSPPDYASFVAAQLSRSRDVIEAHLGHPVDLLAWPFSIHDDELEEAARHAGYVAGFTLGNQAALPGSDILALPRFWISDNERAGQLATVLSRACPSGNGPPS